MTPSGLAKASISRYRHRIATTTGSLSMYALIAVGVTVVVFAVLNLIDYKRLD